MRRSVFVCAITKDCGPICRNHQESKELEELEISSCISTPLLPGSHSTRPVNFRLATPTNMRTRMHAVRSLAEDERSHSRATRLSSLACLK